MNLKRLWDTENKKLVRAIPTWDPHKKLQVWTNDDWSKLYVYDIAGYREINQATVDAETYWPVWKQLADETVGYYLTNVPTDVYNWDSGDKVAYRFLNGTTVLQSWKIDEGETPEYTGDTPTKASTAQYSYTFSGWKPAVWPISKKTDFKAQFNKAVRKYSVFCFSNDSDYWTVDKSSVTADYGTALSVSDNVLTIWTWESATTVTATANEGYVFSSWGEVPATVTDTISLTATFEAVAVPYSPVNSVVYDPVNAEIKVFFSNEDYIDIVYDSQDEEFTAETVWACSNEAHCEAIADLDNNIVSIIYDSVDAVYSGSSATDLEFISGAWSLIETFFAWEVDATSITALETWLWAIEPCVQAKSL